MNAHLIIVGFDEIVGNKYLPCIAAAIDDGYLSGYSIVELETQADSIYRRIGAINPQPSEIYFLPDRRIAGIWADESDFSQTFFQIRQKWKRLIVYIAAEAKAHGCYLNFCVKNEIESLVEKPAICPMDAFLFNPKRIASEMQEVVGMARHSSTRHSVMTLSRYHAIYNDRVVSEIARRIQKYEVPVTSLHFRTAGGVWNMRREYLSREDHPYKYGYGMLMHGAYHYIDLVVQIMELNRSRFPKEELAVSLCSFVAGPSNQVDRTAGCFHRELPDELTEQEEEQFRSITFGETDIVSSYILRSGSRTVCLGTLSFEQTTPSVRNWATIPENLYNKNGRTSSVDLEIQLSTLFSMNVQCFDVPVASMNSVDRIDAKARISTRANASLLEEENYVQLSEYSGLFHSDSNKELMSRWLRGEENRSQLETHLNAMTLLGALAESVQTPGKTVSVAFV